MKRRVPRLDGAARDLARGELIGLEAEVVQATDPGYHGLKGTVVDETLRTLVLRLGAAGARRVRLPKVACTFRFATRRGPVDVDGAAIEFRPEDRTKKVR